MGSFGDVIKSGFQGAYFAPGAFGCDTYFELVFFIKNIHHAIHKIVALAAVDRIAAQPSEYNAQWKFKEGMLANKFDVFPQSAAYQQTHRKIQVRGMRYYGYYVFGRQGVCFDLYPPSQ